MEQKIIELHWYGEPALVNVNNIAIMKNNGFIDTSGREYSIDETYDDLKTLITACGIPTYSV